MTDQVAIVTGASSGIGWATAVALLRRGYRVAAVARRAHRLAQLASFGGEGRLLPLALDVSDVDSPARTVAAVLDRWGRLDVVVAAAGHGRGHGDVPVADRTWWPSQVATNLTAPLLLAAEAMDPLRRSEGHLVLIGSVFGTAPAPGYAAYAATKHGLAGFARSLQREAAGARVHVSLINPGSTNTEFSAATLGAEHPSVPDLDAWPFRPLDPEDVAAAVVWVLSQPPHVTIEEVTLRAAGDR